MTSTWRKKRDATCKDSGASNGGDTRGTERLRYDPGLGRTRSRGLEWHSETLGFFFSICLGLHVRTLARKKLNQF